MPKRALPPLSPQRRAMLERDLVAAVERERLAMLDKCALTAVAYQAGMTTREIGAVLDVTSGTASRWKDSGEQELQRRAANAPGAPE